MNIWKTKDELAKHGRNGDTMMKKIDGDLAHVNPVEYEMSPQDIKEKGAGTINPITGKKEYFLPLALGVIGGAMKIGSIISGNRKKKAAQAAAQQQKLAQLDLAQDERDLQLESSGQVSSFGQQSVGLQTTAATKDLFAQTSGQIGGAGMATQGTIQNIQTSALSDTTAAAQSQIQKLVATRSLEAEKIGIGYEKTEMGIEQQYQNMLSANAPTTGWDAIGQVVGAGISGVSTGLSLMGPKKTGV